MHAANQKADPVQPALDFLSDPAPMFRKVYDDREYDLVLTVEFLLVSADQPCLCRSGVWHCWRRQIRRSGCNKRAK